MIQSHDPIAWVYIYVITGLRLSHIYNPCMYCIVIIGYKNYALLYLLTAGGSESCRQHPLQQPINVHLNIAHFIVHHGAAGAAACQRAVKD